MGWTEKTAVSNPSTAAICTRFGLLGRLSRGLPITGVISSPLADRRGPLGIPAAPLVSLGACAGLVLPAVRRDAAGQVPSTASLTSLQCCGFSAEGVTMTF